ncbi:Polysaccharide biosynthesis/export protein [Posidoniimonas polymericola]|uniref:Polysaccharide biosynthesis/export protein n=1 Tax=Posidoniimonas polymericola TaxID=2528002 RepID=A0A5C5YGV3_9BACT|nr:polysaccharide biosynthesis/export family protein [Posidoniimonas polymericola]TWT73695.1 Polysaccharide biosynthesis/export protein [Posidoniimonas polymericola]
MPLNRLRTPALAGMIAVTLVVLLRPMASPKAAEQHKSAAASKPEQSRSTAPVTAEYRAVAGRAQPVRLCQSLGPAAPHSIWAVDSARGGCQYEVGWDARSCCTPWQSYAQGEYVGHARTAHVPEYRLRVDDTLSVFFLRTREIQPGSYTLQVGDVVRVESLTAGGNTGSSGTGTTTNEDSLNRDLIVQPDGTIKLPLVNRVPAAGRTIEALQEDLEERYTKYYRAPTMTVTPIQVNTRLEDLLETVDARGAINGGRQLSAVVTPAGKIQLPGLGSVYVQGLTLAEAKLEIDSRYANTIPGVTVTVDLSKRAQRFIYVVGEVAQPGRFELEGPTTAMQAIALAGGWQVGSNLRQVVVFRRGPDWRLMATMIDLRGALYGRRPTPADEIWLNDSDIVLVPKNPIQVVDEVVEQVFTRGVYAAVPLELIWGQGFATVSSIISQ